MSEELAADRREGEEHATKGFKVKAAFPKEWGQPPAGADEAELEDWILRHIPPGGTYRRRPRVPSRAARASWVHNARTRRKRRMKGREAWLEIVGKKYPEW